MLRQMFLKGQEKSLHFLLVLKTTLFVISNTCGPAEPAWRSRHCAYCFICYTAANKCWWGPRSPWRGLVNCNKVCRRHLLLLPAQCCDPITERSAASPAHGTSSANKTPNTFKHLTHPLFFPACSPTLIEKPTCHQKEECHCSLGSVGTHNIIHFPSN